MGHLKSKFDFLAPDVYFNKLSDPDFSIMLILDPKVSIVPKKIEKYLYITKHSVPIIVMQTLV